MGHRTRVKALENETGTRPLDLARPCQTMTDEELCRVIALETGEHWHAVKARFEAMTEAELRRLLAATQE